MKDLSMCPKKKKRKQRSPAKVWQFYCFFWKGASLNVCENFALLTAAGFKKEKNNNMAVCLCFFWWCRFSALMMMDHWACRTPSVTSVFTVMLHSEPTTIYRGTSSFTLVWITQSSNKMPLCVLQIRNMIELRGFVVFTIYTLQVRSPSTAASVICASFRNTFFSDMRKSTPVSEKQMHSLADF